MDQKITESHLPGQYLDIALFPGQYLDIALAAGQYKIYCSALAFDPPTQSVTYNYIRIAIYINDHARAQGWILQLIMILDIKGAGLIKRAHTHNFKT